MDLKEYDLGCVNHARDILLRSHNRSHSIEGLAIEVGINRTKLQYGFRKVFGTSIYDFHKKIRMERAENLLQYTKKSIKEIARLTGYSSESAFSTAFKKVYTVPPSIWRKNAANGHMDAH